jgi:hypothetical protein
VKFAEVGFCRIQNVLKIPAVAVLLVSALGKNGNVKQRKQEKSEQARKPCSHEGSPKTAAQLVVARAEGGVS